MGVTAEVITDTLMSSNFLNTLYTDICTIREIVEVSLMSSSLNNSTYIKRQKIIMRSNDINRQKSIMKSDEIDFFTGHLKRVSN